MIVKHLVYESFSSLNINCNFWQIWKVQIFVFYVNAFPWKRLTIYRSKIRTILFYYSPLRIIISLNSDSLIGNYLHPNCIFWGGSKNTLRPPPPYPLFQFGGGSWPPTSLLFPGSAKFNLWHMEFYFFLGIYSVLNRSLSHYAYHQWRRDRGIYIEKLVKLFHHIIWLRGHEYNFF